MSNSSVINALSKTVGDFVNVTVTPEEANILLNEHMAPNRNMSPRVVRKYAKARKEGVWVDLNGDTIKVDEYDRVIDGQHRIAALPECGLPGVFTFVRVRSNVVHTIDTGRARTLADVLRMEGLDKSSNRVASAAKWIYRLRNDLKMNDTDPVDHGILYPIVEEIVAAETDSFVISRIRGRGATRGICPDGQMVAFCHEARLLGVPDTALEEFIDGIYRGINIQPGDARYAFRSRMLRSLPGSNRGLTSARRFELLLKAFNRWINDIRTEQLHARPLEKDAIFPKIGTAE